MKKSVVALVLLMAIVGGVSCAARENDKAQAALTDYFSFLSQGNYEQATRRYGGEYDVLVDWNPEVDPADHARLFEMGCTVNGLQCLPVMEIGAIEHSGEGTYEFYVKFENRDGSLFFLETSAEANKMPVTESTFKYTAFRSGDGFLIRELPIYVP